MQTRKLGRTGLEPSLVSAGTWALGGWGWGSANDDAARRTIRYAHEVGVTAIDTAPAYGCGHSEEIVGQAIRGKRDKFIIMTKAGIRWDDATGQPIATVLVDPSGREVRLYRNSRPDSLRHEAEASLRRLGVDTIDLLQIHWPDPETPIADTMGALVDLRREGKIREIGVCNFPVALAAEAQRALGDVPLASVQAHYSLLRHDSQASLLEWAIRERVGFLAYSPLEHGLLTGLVRDHRQFEPGDHRSNHPLFTLANRASVNRLLDQIVVPIAEKHSATVTQVVLAWAVAQPGVSSALVGLRSTLEAQEDAGSAEVTLSSEELYEVKSGFQTIMLERHPRGLVVRLVAAIRSMLGVR